MTDADALAIKAYLFSLAPVHAPRPPNTLAFPFNQRWADGLLVAVLQSPITRFEPNTAQSAEWNRGAYLAEALAHCGECHTPRNLAFALDNRNKFAGAMTAGWRAFNITSRQEHRRRRLERRRSVRLSLHRPRDGPRHRRGPDGRSGRPQLQPSDAGRHPRAGHLSAQRSADRVTRLPAHGRAAGAGLAQGRRRPSRMRAARQIFEGACASCHGWTGVSPISPYATLTGARAVNDPRRHQCGADRDLRARKRHTPQGDGLDAGVRRRLFRYARSRPSPITSPRASAPRRRSSPRAMWLISANRLRSRNSAHSTSP